MRAPDRRGVATPGSFPPRVVHLPPEDAFRVAAPAGVDAGHRCSSRVAKDATPGAQRMFNTFELKTPAGHSTRPGSRRFTHVPVGLAIVLVPVSRPQASNAAPLRNGWWDVLPAAGVLLKD
jgi:hypothetical protein